MSSAEAHILLPVEAEAFVGSLQKYDIQDIGNTRWSRQHENIEKLNMQAVVSATAQNDEFVKEFLINHEKIPVLVQELITTEVWTEKVFTELIAMDFKPKTTFCIYMVLYHEATIANLLETIMYHGDSSEAAEDVIIDLLDYCYRKLVQLVADTDRDESEEESDEEEVDRKNMKNTSNAMKELQKQSKTLNFDICIKMISVVRYIADNLEGLPLCVMTRLLNTHDIPNLLVQLIEHAPWVNREKGKLSKYIDGKWQPVSDADTFLLTKTEGQVWIALFHLLMDQNCQQKYELNSYRKHTLLKLRSYLNAVVLDQLPVLGELQRYLEHLSMMDPPPIKQDLVLEQLPEIRSTILKENSGKWGKIARKQAKTVFSPSDAEMREQAKRWADTYNMSAIENLLTDVPNCVLCGELATKRCSRCQNEWYCRRECQVNHWTKHKTACNIMYDAQQQLNQES